MSTSSSPTSAVVDRDVLVAYLGRFLGLEEGRDYCPNGLQVEGRHEIRKLITGVSACVELFQRARRAAADAVVVHHGIFWQGESRVITGAQRRRVAELLLGELNLLAYHLPLDRHPEVGNNAVAARSLGLIDLEPFGDHDGMALGFKGRLAQAVSMDEMMQRCSRLYDRRPLAFAHGPERVSSIGIVSGAAARCLHQAIDASLDLFITGEASEWSMNLARDAEIHFIAAGHHATEKLGVQALGEHLEREFGVEARFIDVPNPV